MTNSFQYKPNQAHLRIRKEYPAFRWITRSNGFQNTPWKQYPDKMVKTWGKEQQWSVVVDEEGATIYGPDGDAVMWEDPK